MGHVTKNRIVLIVLLVFIISVSSITTPVAAQDTVIELAPLTYGGTYTLLGTYFSQTVVVPLAVGETAQLTGPDWSVTQTILILDAVRITITHQDGSNAVYYFEQTGVQSNIPIQPFDFTPFLEIGNNTIFIELINLYLAPPPDLTAYGTDGIYLHVSPLPPPPPPGQTGSPPVVEVAPPPPLTNEQINGVTRPFDDGVVVAQLLSGQFQYYLPNGCLVGLTEPETFANVNLSERYIIESLEGCDGYHIDVWSLGYPACQVQVNFYGPDGFERVYQRERQVDDPSCLEDTGGSESVDTEGPIHQLDDHPTDRASGLTCVYTAQNGDSLSQIAVEFGVTIEALVTANSITESQSIIVGQQLNIPTPDCLGVSFSSSPSSTISSNEGWCTYEIYYELLAHYRRNPAPTNLDFNNDGMIDIIDYNACLSNWAEPTSPNSSEQIQYITITQQGIRQFSYSNQEGCVIGSTEPRDFVNSDVDSFLITQTLEGCGGYRVYLAFEREPTCQFQIHTLTPNGTRNIRGLVAHPSDPQCQDLTDTAVPSCVGDIASVQSWLSEFRQFNRQSTPPAPFYLDLLPDGMIDIFDYTQCLSSEFPGIQLEDFLFHATQQTLVYVGPNTAHTTLGSTDTGQTYRAMGKNGNNLWLQIDFNGRVGWICSTFTNFVYFDLLTIADDTAADCAETSAPAAPLPQCPQGTGPGGLPPGNYPRDRLSDEQHQWLWEIFGHGDEGAVPEGYGGESCGNSRGQDWLDFVCSAGHVGPNGITPGSYNIDTLTREQHQWLWEIFGHGDEGAVPEGYGGEDCSSSPHLENTNPSIVLPPPFDQIPIHIHMEATEYCRTLGTEPIFELTPPYGWRCNTPTPDIPNNSESVPTENNCVYFVQTGDTLSEIGYQLGVSWTNIATVNGISAPYTIYVGQALNIPGEGCSSPTIPPTNSDTVSPGTGTQCNGGYVPNWAWLNFARYNELISRAQAEIDILTEQLNFFSWIERRGVDYVRNELIEYALNNLGLGTANPFVTETIGVALNFVMGSEADTHRNLRIYTEFHSGLEGYWNNPTFRRGSCVHVPASLSEIPVTSFPLWWVLLADYFPPFLLNPLP